MPNMNKMDYYSLRQVANLTGLSEFTLRGWEGRYNAFEPSRTHTGRRLYSQNDIRRAFLLRELTELGHRIGDIAQQSNTLLKKKLDSSGSQYQELTAKTSKGIEALMKLTVFHEWDKLKQEISTLVRKQKPLLAIERIILPILGQLGMFVASRKISIAQEHILSALIKGQLYALLSRPRKPVAQQKFSVVLASPEGDFHDIGLLIAHVIFNSLGVRSLFMGPNTPKSELCETALRFGATHVLLASTVSRSQGAREEIYSYIHHVDQNLPKTVALWVGGRNFEKLSFNLSRDFKYFDNLLNLPNSVRGSVKKARCQQNMKFQR